MEDVKKNNEATHESAPSEAGSESSKTKLEIEGSDELVEKLTKVVFEKLKDEIKALIPTKEDIAKVVKVPSPKAPPTAEEILATLAGKLPELVAEVAEKQGVGAVNNFNGGVHVTLNPETQVTPTPRAVAKLAATGVEYLPRPSRSVARENVFRPEKPLAMVIMTLGAEIRDYYCLANPATKGRVWIDGDDLEFPVIPV